MEIDGRFSGGYNNLKEEMNGRNLHYKGAKGREQWSFQTRNA